jgi:hypothetical protein
LPATQGQRSAALIENGKTHVEMALRNIKRKRIRQSGDSRRGAPPKMENNPINRSVRGLKLAACDIG